VYREGVTRIVEDCFSPHFNLLTLCPNGQHKIWGNMDKYVPNPRLTSPIAISYLEFLGKMIGISIRVQLCLPFNFPPIIWKKLVGQDPDISDLKDMDSLIVQQVSALRNCEEEGITDSETFDDHYGRELRHTYTGSDGEERELFLGGKGKAVTFANREAYCDSVVKARLHEFDMQAATIARGLATVVPMRAVKLFTWSELEVLVCGSPKVDMELWQSRTEYQGYSGKDDPTIKMFWKVMHSLSEEDRSGFIRFSWGRSRLPPASAWTQNFRITRMSSTTRLPVTHTCFFQVELPQYPTEEKMRHSLLVAIHFGMSGILNN